VGQVHAGEVGGSRGGEGGEFLGGAGHVQGGADTGARFLQQGQPLPRRVLVAAVERGGSHADDLTRGGIPDRPELDDPGPVTRGGGGGGRLRGGALVAHRRGLVGDPADAAEEAFVCGGRPQLLPACLEDVLAALRGRV